MNNPYQTPESDLAVKSVEMPKTLWWKIFFFISLILLLLNIFSIVVVQQMTYSPGELIDFFASAIGLVGLFGLAFNRRFVTQNFWKYFFYCYLLVYLAFSLVFPILSKTFQSLSIAFYGNEELGTLEIGYFLVELFGILSVWASYLYAFKRPQIWNRTHKL